MEPTSAIGVAAAAIQFLDFGSRLLSSSCDIYRSPSGQTAKQVALSAIVGDLSSLLNQVEQTISAGLRSGAHPSPAQDRLLGLCGECKNLIAPLNQSLSRLQRDRASDLCFGGQDAEEKCGRGVLMSLRLALKAVWNESEIVETFDKLDAMKRRITAAALFALWWVPISAKMQSPSPLSYSNVTIIGMTQNAASTNKRSDRCSLASG
jgi:hypothetical protein